MVEIIIKQSEEIAKKNVIIRKGPIFDFIGLQEIKGSVPLQWDNLHENLKKIYKDFELYITIGIYINNGEYR
jgi:hypothetical protein